MTSRDRFQFDVPTSSVSSASVSSHSRTSPYSGNDKKTASANALQLRCRALVSCGKGVAKRALKISLLCRSVNTHRAVQGTRHLHGLPIAFSIARHSTARPRRRRGRLPASSFPRQPLGPKDKENKRDLILLPSRFGETSTRFRRETRRGNESTGSRLGARDMPHEGAGRNAVVLGRFDRAFSMPTTEKTLVARLNFTCSRRGTAQKRFTHPYHDHLTRFLPLPPPPSHT